MLALHRLSSRNRDAVQGTRQCGCFYCLQTFEASAVEDWVPESDGLEVTALCPFCGIDSVLPAREGAPIDVKVLKAMHAYWFERTVTLPIEPSLTGTLRLRLEPLLRRLKWDLIGRFGAALYLRNISRHVNSKAPDSPFTPRAAALTALLVALGAAAVSYVLARNQQSYGDFLAWWHGARVLLDGGNPYEWPPNFAPFFIDEQLFYPLTALVAALPLARLPYHIALATFFGLGSGLLAYGVARTAPHRLALFCGFPFIMSAQLGAWSPYVAAALVLPALGFFVAVKPNIGLAALVTRPSRPMVIGAAILVVISIAAMPSWPGRWLDVLPLAPPHLTPIATWLGAPLALALLRWRRPEARLLFAMSLVPQTAMFADQLLLFLVPQTRRQSLALALISAVGGVAWMARLRLGGHPAIVGAPYVLASVYLPALFVILRQANTGAIPGWVERRVQGLPGWLRGSPGLERPGTATVA